MARINQEITDLKVKKIIITITTIITISKLEEDKFFIFDITMFY